ncbi:MAG: ferritin [Endomicrobia bacterium]|nr:ferritin [Endomicrobiia bacterium]
MGQKGIEIIEKSGLKVADVVAKLNKAFADEWLAYYQYWVGAQVCVGIFREDVQAELTEHANEELGHAQKVADRIIELGGTPITDPAEWPKLANCKYEAPKNPDTRVLLKQNIDGERCAIEVYKELADFTRGKDVITYHMALEIMKDELGHEQDLEDIVDDISHVDPSKKK